MGLFSKGTGIDYWGRTTPPELFEELLTDLFADWFELLLFEELFAELLFEELLTDLFKKDMFAEEAAPDPDLAAEEADLFAEEAAPDPLEMRRAFDEAGVLAGVLADLG